MKAILRAFGRLACGVTRKHIWGRAFDVGEGERHKRCARCGEMREVKRRKRSGT
mgnify:CR=1 FL=1